jgi:hypothetical protein
VRRRLRQLRPLNPHPTDLVRRLGGGKSRVARARIRPRLRERSPTPFAYPSSLNETTLHTKWMSVRPPVVLGGFRAVPGRAAG